MEQVCSGFLTLSVDVSGVGVGACFGGSPRNGAGSLGTRLPPPVEQEGGVCQQYHATCTLQKSNTSLRWEDPSFVGLASFVGSARGPSAWVTHPHPPLTLLTAPAICRLPAHDSLILYSASTGASRPPPTPLLSGPPRRPCLQEGDVSQIIRTGSLLCMLATEMLVCAKRLVPVFPATSFWDIQVPVPSFPPSCPALATGH